jgi:hypothetical protein
MYTYNIVPFFLPILAILSKIFSYVEIYSETKLNVVEIQISKRKSVKNFPFSITRFLLLSFSLCMYFTLKSQEIATPDFINQNFPGGACRPTPYPVRVLEHD